MARLSELLVQSALPGPDAAQKGAESMVQLGNQISQIEQRRSNIELQKADLQAKKMGTLINTLKTGLTNVPKKARTPFFNNFFRNQAAQLGFSVSDEFIAGLQSPDIDPTALVKSMIDMENQIQVARDTGDTKGIDLTKSELASYINGDGSILMNLARDVVKGQQKVEAQQAAIEATDERQRRRQAFQTEQAIVKETNTIASKSQALAAFRSALNEVEDLFPGLVTEGKAPKEIPGFGLIQGKLADVFQSKRGKEVRQKIKNLRNEVLKAGGGKALTIPEQQLFNEAFGIATGLFDLMSEDQLVTGISTVKNRFNEFVRSVRGSGRPESARRAQEERGINLSEFRTKRDPGLSKGAFKGLVSNIQAFARRNPNMKRDEIAAEIKRQAKQGGRKISTGQLIQALDEAGL